MLTDAIKKNLRTCLGHGVARDLKRARDAPRLINRKLGKRYAALREQFIESVAVLDFEYPPRLFPARLW